MTPVEELRKAAALMRERAKAATGGGRPWFIGDCTVYPRWILAENGEENGTGYNDDVIRVDELDDSFEVTNADWEHVASWHPQVALAVAAWLDVHAEQLGFGDGNFDACDSPGDVQRALDVARTYLGGAS